MYFLEYKKIKIEFEKKINPEYRRNDPKQNPFEELECQLLIEFSFRGRKRLITSNFLEMDSNIRLCLTIDEILKDKFSDLDISFKDDDFENIVFALVEDQGVELSYL